MSGEPMYAKDDPRNWANMTRGQIAYDIEGMLSRMAEYKAAEARRVRRILCSDRNLPRSLYHQAQLARPLGYIPPVRPRLENWQQKVMDFFRFEAPPKD